MTPKERHDKWLRKQGLHPEQLARKPKHVNKIPDLRVDSSNTSGEGIPTWSRGTYRKTIIEALQEETPETQGQILKKMEQVQPAFNKGGLQYIPNKEDMKTNGRR